MTVVADNSHGEWHLKEMTIVVDVCYSDGRRRDNSRDG